jgi:hypothetical protein
MQLDADILAKLAAFGTNLEAPKGESLEDIQQARRAKLAKQISDLETRIANVRGAARQAAQEHDQYLNNARQSILNNERYTGLDRRYALRDLGEYTLASHEVFDREMRPVRELQRQLRELQRQLDKS